MMHASTSVHTEYVPINPTSVVLRAISFNFDRLPLTVHQSLRVKDILAQHLPLPPSPAPPATASVSRGAKVTLGDRFLLSPSSKEPVYYEQTHDVFWSAALRNGRLGVSCFHQVSLCLMLRSSLCEMPMCERWDRMVIWTTLET